MRFGNDLWSARGGIHDNLRPGGSPYVDGIRLAIINTAWLVLALVVLAIVSLVSRIVDWLLPFPERITSVVTVIGLAALALLFWYRYAREYNQVARLRTRATRPDVFGAIGGAPFAIVAVALLLTGSISLLLAAITFSLSRVGDALQQLGLAALFAVLAIANVVIARAASDQE